ncbi:MAG: zinc ABC transporter substrate-binding protein [Castellaniella sp.]|uniref:metal ABC transporter solute-binding protein, Zn/Mn family n=1 Tax=Castellaniella sp. TaxID=1955812 RepID=UPI002A36D989|nr:zinc ABC transporter substrate-binding protein [Castellaniella sp.]MDY0308930.1 zinc ABC transporter substrate-binding protein [Castellaniella sp.]
MNLKAFFAVVLGAAAISLGGVARAEAINAVTSFGILADVVRNVGGTHVKVRSLVPPGGDPHEFEPSPDDAKALKAADIVFLSGEGLESWFERLAKASGTQVAPVVVSEGITIRTMEEDGETVRDPHVWNSIPNVLIWVRNIEAALSRKAPEDAAVFKENAQRYAKQLEALDASIRARIGAVPENRRQVLTSHDAFGYYAQEYGVRFLAPQGVSTEAEPSAAQIAELIDQIKRDHIQVYFIENSNSAQLVEQVAKATGARPGGELYPESLSPAGGPAATYVKLMEHNTDQIVSAIAR